MAQLRLVTAESFCRWVLLPHRAVSFPDPACGSQDQPHDFTDKDDLQLHGT